jgi:hypothetical protein
VRRAAVLFVLAAALAAIGIRGGIGPHDEGLMLQWGRRIAGGEWLYRDIWANYLPGQPLVQAVLGDSLIVWRVVRVLVGAAAAVLAYLVVRRDAGERWALGAWAAVAAALAWPLSAGPNASAVALAFGALLLGRERPVGGGALAGLAALFRPEVGVAAALAVALDSRGRRRWWALPVAAATLLAGLLPFLVVAPGDLLSQTFGFVDEQRLQRLALQLAPHTTDPNKVLERLFPALLVAGVVVWAVLAARRRGHALAWVPLVLVGLGYLLARPDEFHLVPLGAFLAVAVALAAARERLTALRVAGAAVLAVIVVHGLDRQAGRVRHTGPQAAVADGVRTDRADALALRRLRAAVDRRSRPGDPILSAPPRYDRVRVGDTLLYVLLDRRDPTRYDVVQPGVVTTAPVQREMVRDLERSGTRLVVRWLAPVAAQPEDNGSGRSSGVTILDDHLRSRFRPVGRFGDYELLERR